MKTYLKRKSYGEEEPKNTLDDFDYHKSDLRFHLDRTTNSYRYRLVESIKVSLSCTTQD
jgi:hypothetical protein